MNEILAVGISVFLLILAYAIFHNMRINKMEAQTYDRFDYDSTYRMVKVEATVFRVTLVGNCGELVSSEITITPSQESPFQYNTRSSEKQLEGYLSHIDHRYILDYKICSERSQHTLDGVEYGDYYKLGKIEELRKEEVEISWTTYVLKD